MTHMTCLDKLFDARDILEFENVQEAFDRIKHLYETHCQDIREALQAFAKDDKIKQPDHATYPLVGIIVQGIQEINEVSYSFGMINTPGVYACTVTQPVLFETYLKEQLSILKTHYPELKIYVGLSHDPIPLPFVIDKGHPCLSKKHMQALKTHFVHPQLIHIDDHIVNHTYTQLPHKPAPLSLFTAERTDFSLHRLHHYTGTAPRHFQNFILLTNYQRYIGEFYTYALEKLKEDKNFIGFVGPGDFEINQSDRDKKDTFYTPMHLPQMPAYHLKRADGNGITFINMGVGPSNAKTITDHLAVLRPHCWMMLGHCAGLRQHQMLGDYVLAHGYVREDHVLDQDLPLWVPVPPIAEIQIALQQAVTDIMGNDDLKSRLRTGTVFTTDNRNWELKSLELYERLNQSRAIAIDMESATVAANGLRFRVPYGTLLCVSDKPIHGDIKLRGTANAFYEERVAQHLKIGLRSIDLILASGIDALHSRKLRGFDEPAFR